MTLGLLAGATTAFAAETEETAAAATCWRTGQEQSLCRNALYAQAAEIEDEAEREAFLQANGIADTPYSPEAAACYGYVTGCARGAGFRLTDDEQTAPNGYGYQAGRQRGASYCP